MTGHATHRPILALKRFHERMGAKGLRETAKRYVNNHARVDGQEIVHLKLSNVIQSCDRCPASPLGKVFLKE